MASPIHLEDVAEDDGEDGEDDDQPPTINAELLDHSPLDFSTLSYTLPT
jgi:hypothetical protein